MFSRSISNLIKQFQHSNWRIRQKTVQNLQALHEEAKNALPKLYELIDCRSEHEYVRKAALDAVISIENDKSTLISKLIKWLNKDSDEEYYIRYTAAEALGEEKIKKFLESEPEKRNEILKKLKDKSESDKFCSIRLSLKKAIAQIENQAPPVDEFIELIKNDDKNTKKVAAKALGSLKKKAKNTLPELEKLLKQEEESVCLYIQIAIDRIRGLFPTTTFLNYLKTDNKSLLELALIELKKLGVDSNKNEALTVLMDILRKNLSDSRLSLISLEIIINILEKDERALADILIQVLDMNRTELGIRVALELESLAPKLLRLIDQKILQPEILLKNLKQEIALQEKTNIIKTLVEQADSYEPLRLLIKEWANWIAEGKETFLISITADVLREQKLAVLPLISLLEDLEYEWQPTDKLDKEIRQQANQEIQKIGERQTNKKYTLLLQDKINEQVKERKQNIEIKIFQLLAKMSDKKFFGRYKDDPDYQRYENLYLEIKDELSKHATPVLARRLANESNSKICELITLILANNGGFYATNALASRTHYDRKELLTEYYLKPAKKQSEDAAEMLKGTVKAAHNTFVIQKGLNIVMFLAGLGLLTGALFTGMRSENKAQLVTAAVAGVGGLGGMIFHFVNKPLERIQNSMADLVQAETAFTSYIWELNLNNAFIQSQYMENGVLSNDEIERTVERTQNVTKLTLELVDTHLEQNEQPPIAILNGVPTVNVQKKTTLLSGLWECDRGNRLK